MNAGKETKMLRGAVWACAIPMGLGFLFLLQTLFEASASQSGSDTVDVFLIMGPILFCFIFGTPLSAWLSCRSLKKIEGLKELTLWRNSAKRGFLSATFVQISVAIVHVGLVSAYLSGLEADQSWKTNQDDGLAEILMVSIIFNFMLWVIVTLPLSLICATIFWRITKFPKDGIGDSNVF